MSKATKLKTPPIPVFRELMEKTNTKREDIAKAIGVSSVAVGQYYNGETLPAIDKLIKIADFFNVSTDYLLERTKIKSTDANIKEICEYTGLSERSLNNILALREHKLYFPCFVKLLENHYMIGIVLFLSDYVYDSHVEYQNIVKQRKNIKEHISECLLQNPSYNFFEDAEYMHLITSEHQKEELRDFKQWKLCENINSLIDEFVDKYIQKPDELDIPLHDYLRECAPNCFPSDENISVTEIIHKCMSCDDQEHIERKQN